jgi:four helix bundle protein
MDDPALGGIASEYIRSQSTRSCSTSVPLNIAEGNGKFTAPDRCRFFDNARGSALESAACLDVMLAKKFVSAAETQAGKTTLVKIVSMLYGLIRANSDVRVFEESASYRPEKEGEKGRKQQE